MISYIPTLARISLTDWAKDNPAYLYAICTAALLLVVYTLLCRKWFKGAEQADFQQQEQPAPALRPGGGGCRWALAASCLIAAVSLSLLLYTSWLRGDEWMFTPGMRSYGWRAINGIASYLFRNSRLGETVGFFVGVSECKWQVFLLNPLFAIAIPFALLRLFGRRGESMASPMGLCFFWFTFLLALMSACLSPWRNYTCFAASVNYLWPSVVILFFLSLFNPGQWHPEGVLKYPLWKRVGVLLLGLYCGCSVESLSVTLLPVLTVWMFWRLLKKKGIPVLCRLAYLGFLWGTYFLFASPALYRREDSAIPDLAIDVSSFTSEQMAHFVQNLTWEQLDGITGGGCIVILKGIPLLYHTYFLPFLADKFLQCCSVGCVTFALLLVLLAFQRGAGRKRTAIGSLVLFALGWVCAVSYTAQCIPMHMSFLPAAFFILAACAYIFLAMACNRAWLACSISLLCVAGLAFSTFVPAGIDAWPLKRVEQERFAEIHRQMEQGNKVVEYELQIDYIPDDPLCLTDFHMFPLTENPKAWSNDLAAYNYPFDALVQHGPAEGEHPRKPAYGPCYDTLYSCIRWLKNNVLHSQSDPFGKPR
ncbi:MAG: DUF6056 family protein [Akkermansia sp.]|nr:DUF6056 family protein [Akkermansia sp.]